MEHPVHAINLQEKLIVQIPCFWLIRLLCIAFIMCTYIRTGICYHTRKSNLPLGGASTGLMSLPSFRVKARSYFDPIICYIAQASVFSPCLVTLLSSGLFTGTQWSIFLFLSFQNKVPIISK